MNRLISPKSSYRRGGLAPRCRLFATWGCSRSQGLGCSPMKAERELGSTIILSSAKISLYARTFPKYINYDGLDSNIYLEFFIELQIKQTITNVKIFYRFNKIKRKKSAGNLPKIPQRLHVK
jgi:hypothetical protein